MILGLTGGVGAGKSTVAGILKDNYDAALILSDDVAKDLMKKGKESYNAIVSHFTGKVLNEDGNIDNEKLAKIVFEDSRQLQWLNDATHPIVIRQIEKIIDEYRKQNKKLIVLESALLNKSGCDKLCDYVWYVCTKDDERIIRLGRDRGYSKEKSESIFMNQDSDGYYSGVCDEIIYNNRDIDELNKNVKKSMNLLNERFKLGF